MITDYEIGRLQDDIKTLESHYDDCIKQIAVNGRLANRLKRIIRWKKKSIKKLQKAMKHEAKIT